MSDPQKPNADVIPAGIYCNGHTGRMKKTIFNGAEIEVPESLPCPYWSLNPDQEPQNNGYCAFLGRGDWEDVGVGLIWDQVKACGINDADEFEEEEPIGSSEEK